MPPSRGKSEHFCMGKSDCPSTDKMLLGRDTILHVSKLLFVCRNLNPSYVIIEENALAEVNAKVWRNHKGSEQEPITHFKS